MGVGVALPGIYRWGCGLQLSVFAQPFLRRDTLGRGLSWIWSLETWPLYHP